MTVNNALRLLLAALIATFIGVVSWNLHDRSAQEGGRAPDFHIKTDEGREISLRSFGDKVVVLNFWATWCQPCVQEIPSLSQFQKRFAQKGVIVLAVSVDKNDQKYKAFLNMVRVSFATARDPNSDLSAKYGTFQFPESYIIRNGKVLRKFAAAEDWVSDDMTQYVQSLLAG